MSKYEPLKRHLESLVGSEWRATFTEIEAVLGFVMPASARRHQPWWANDATGHSHARAWLDAGWRTSDVDIADERVKFRRIANVQRGFAESAAYEADAPERRPAVRERLTIGLDATTMRRLETKAALAGRTVQEIARGILSDGARLTGEEKAAVVRDLRSRMPKLHDIDIPSLVRSGRDDEFE